MWLSGSVEEFKAHLGVIDMLQQLEECGRAVLAPQNRVEESIPEAGQEDC